MGCMAAKEPVDRFDRIWTGWVDIAPLEERIAQHRVGRERFLQALQQALGSVPSPFVLEIGCGSAIDLGLLVQSALGVVGVGVDISLPALQAARIFVARLGVKVALCGGDAFALPFRSETFGLVFSQGVLEHFRNPSAAMREQVRVLASDGILVVNVPQRWTGYTLHKHRAIRRGRWPWGWEGEFTARHLLVLGCAEGLECLHHFGCQYWMAWGEPAWILRDLYGKIHRRNPLAAVPPFPQLDRLYNRLWTWLESRYGHLFMQNVVAVFRKPGTCA